MDLFNYGFSVPPIKPRIAQECKSIPPINTTDPNGRSRIYLKGIRSNVCSCVSLQISGTITNTGHSVIFTADNETSSGYGGGNGGGGGVPQTPVNLTGGPLSYRYRFQEIHIHYGLHDQFGSEHSVEGYTFPAEVSSFPFTWDTGES